MSDSLRGMRRCAAGALLRLSRTGVLRRRFLEQLARVWYNFDSLAAARVRPLRSWDRAAAAIADATRALVGASADFVARKLLPPPLTEPAASAAAARVGAVETDAFVGGQSEAEVAAEYIQLVGRLGI